MQDPQEIVRGRPMGRTQIIAVAVGVGINAVDGYDILSISMAAPGVAKSWHLDPATLGLLLSMELIGMGIGSALFGRSGDRFGRRKTLLGGLLLASLFMFACSLATNFVTLAAARLGVGLVVGTILPALTAMMSETASGPRRDFCISLMGAGYPAGAIIGGSVSALLLQHYDWRAVFVVGGVLSALLAGAVFFLVPETLAFLSRSSSPGALDRVNAALRRMGHPTIQSLPESPTRVRGRLADLFSPTLAASTIWMAVSNVLHVTTFYFALKWVPKIVADMGYTPSQGSQVLVFMNVGGLVGSLGFGYAARKMGLRPATITACLLSVVTVAAFGFSSNLTSLLWLATIAGIATNAGMVGVFAMMARTFPDHLRSTGVGFALGVGRGGGVAAPIVAGILFQSGFGLPVVAVIISCGSLLAAISLRGVRLQH